MRNAGLREILCLAIAAASTAPAIAQSDVVVMRRTIAPPTKKFTAQPTTSYYSWQVSPWVETGACGQQGRETRSVACVRTDGVTVDDANCVGNGSGPRPVTDQGVTVTQSCSYTWQAGAWNTPPSSCGTTYDTRDVTCLRSDGAIVGTAQCSGTSQPAASAYLTNYSGCSFSWSAGEWGNPSTACGTATETRTVTCQRGDGVTVGDGACVSSGARPPSTQTLQETYGCASYWFAGDWGDPSPACGPTTASRSVYCMSGAGAVLPEAECKDPKPATTQSESDYSTCAFGWKPSDWTAPTNTCGDNQETRTFTCVDSGGRTVDASNCTQTRPASTRTDHVVTGCTTDWQTGDYGAVQPGCGPTIQVRSVTCMRSDGQAQYESACNASTRPSSTEPATDYSACTYAWAAGPWSEWTSTCGDATQTRVVTCQRADGTTADDASCTAAKPATTQSSYQASGCSYGWQASAWSVTPACGPTTETRYATCMRSDGQSGTSSDCNAIDRPSLSQATTDYSTCNFSWAVGDWSAPSSGCGDATEIRDVTCQRSDGAKVGDDQCSAQGAKPDSTQAIHQTASCSYAWVSNEWGTPVAACGSSTQTRTNYCRRSDGATVGDSMCTGAQPATSQPVNDYTICSYSWKVSQWSSQNLCGVSATQTRTVACQRSNGDAVADASCTAGGAGDKPADSQTITDYSGCTYAWQDVYGAWSSTCSTKATRTDTPTCQRSDKTPVDTSYCDASTKPSATQTQSVTTGCTYAGTYGNPTTCTPVSGGNSDGTNGTQTVSLTNCTRADGATVDNSLCTPSTKAQNCNVQTASSQYVRQAATLVDVTQSSIPAASRPVNDASGTTFVYAVRTTQCWDATNGKVAADVNCQYLTAGANVGDRVSIAATYVSGSKSVYVSENDLLSALPNQIANSTLVWGNDNVSHWLSDCTGANGTASANTITDSVMVSGAYQTWTMRCGTPPTSSSRYVREIASWTDLNATSQSAAVKQGNASTASTFSYQVRSTTCWDNTSNASSAAANCTSGPSVGDVVAYAATYNTATKIVNLGYTAIKASAPHANVDSVIMYDQNNTGHWLSDCTGKSGTSAASTISTDVYVGGTAQVWKMTCSN